VIGRGFAKPAKPVRREALLLPLLEGASLVVELEARAGRGRRQEGRPTNTGAGAGSVAVAGGARAAVEWPGREG
jgi:hypothetical protein